MPSTLLLYQRDAEASASSQTRSAPASAQLNQAEIALVAVFSALIFGIMAFCVFRFCPGMCGRQRRKADRDQPSTEIKQTFLDLDDDKTLAQKHAPRTEVVQTFLHLDEDKSLAEKKGLGIDMHPALRSWNDRSKQKHSQNRNESLDSTSSTTPLIKRSDAYPISPPLTYSPRNYSPGNPPLVPEHSAEVRVSPKPIRPLPTPVQPIKRLPDHPSRYDISPVQSSSTLPHRSPLPMSFLTDIDAKREDQTAGQRTVSPLQSSLTPLHDRLQSESQLSSRNVSPISVPSTSPVITYPSHTPLYLPRPFSKYNPYRPALEPATSKNWPLENITIPEHQAIAITTTAPTVLTPIHKQLSQSSMKPSATTSLMLERSPSQASTVVASVAPEKPSASQVTHPELDEVFLEDFHRRRRQHQKAKQEAQKQKRKAEREQREKTRKQKQEQLQQVPSAAAAASIFRPAKKLPKSSRAEKGIPPNPPPQEGGMPRSRPLIRTETTTTRSNGTSTAERRRSLERKTVQKSMLISTTNPTSNITITTTTATPRTRKNKTKEPRRAGLPPRLPSKSRKPSQSPDAYENARRISGLHELVGSSSSSAVTTPCTSPTPGAFPAAPVPGTVGGKS